MTGNAPSGLLRPGVDDRLPRGLNFSGHDEFGPEVDEERAVHDRTREHGALASPGGRPHCTNAA